MSRGDIRQRVGSSGGGGGGGGPPTGPAGGDLSGTYPNPVVDGLQTVPIEPGAPVLGEVLTFNGVSWEALPPASVAPSGPAGGDLSGTYPNPTVDGLQTVPVSAVAPNPGDVLTFSGGNWIGVAPATGDITAITGSNHIIITNGTGPVPDVATDATTTPDVSVVMARDAAGMAHARGYTVYNTDASVAGTITGVIGGYISLLQGAGSPLGIQVGTFTAGTPTVSLQGVTAIVFETVDLYSIATRYNWYEFGDGLVRVDTPDGNGLWTELYTAKVDGFTSAFTRRDEDTPAGGYLWTTQQPEAGATGTNRDSGGATVAIQVPEDEAGGGRWGQTATQWATSAVEDREYHGVINTTDATPTSILGAQSNALPASSSATVFVKFKIRNTTTDASRTEIYIMHWGRTGAAAPTQRGATGTVFSDGDAIAGTRTVIVTGNALVPQSTGVAATNLRVSCEMVVSLES